MKRQTKRRITHMLKGTDLRVAKFLYQEEQYTCEEIGRRLNVTTSVVAHSLKRNGVSLREQGKPRITKKQIAQMKKLSKAGHGHERIAHKLGISRSSVYKFLREQ